MSDCVCRRHEKELHDRSKATAAEITFLEAKIQSLEQALKKGTNSMQKLQVESHPSVNCGTSAINSPQQLLLDILLWQRPTNNYIKFDFKNLI